jgi:hypothetical protein
MYRSIVDSDHRPVKSSMEMFAVRLSVVSLCQVIVRYVRSVFDTIR